MTELARATVRMPGTCGELVQGALGGLTFLVTCPIDCYAEVSVTLERLPTALVYGQGDIPKALSAARATLALFGRDDLSARLQVRSLLPRAKGLGTSTADVAGAIFATALALGLPITPWQVARLALAIEPSDGSMFPGISLFDHRGGRLYEDLGPAPPLEIAVLDFGGAVDTVAFNRQDWSAVLRDNEPTVAEALSLVRQGIREGRPDLVGRAASLSARANQRLLFKRELDVVEDLAREVGAVGVNVGHSGTVIGILVDARRSSAEEALALARRNFSTLSTGFACRLAGGGAVLSRRLEPVA